MKSKNLIILVVVAVVLGGLAIISTHRTARPAPAAVGRELLPDLDVNAITQVTIASDVNTVSLARKDGTWVVEDRFDYPADFDKVSKLLLTLAEQKISQTAALDEDQMAELKLCAPDTPDAAPGQTGTRVSLHGAGGTTLASLIVGRPRIRKLEGPVAGYGGFPDGQYVLTSDGQPCLLAQALSEANPDPASWLLSQLPNVPAGEIKKVVMTRTDGTSSVLIRSEDGKLVLTDLGEDQEMDSSATYQVEGALSYMRLVDVANPTLTEKDTGLDAPGVYTATTKDGQVFTVDIGASPQASRERYARFRVAFDPNLRSAIDLADDADEAARDAAEQAEQKAQDKLQEETDALNATLGAWVFVIERHKADGMLNARDVLIKKDEVKTASEPIEKVEARRAQAVALPRPQQR